MHGGRRIAVALTAAALVVSGAPRGAPAAGGSPVTLAVHHRGVWHTFWRSDRAPARWPRANSTVARALTWRRLADGLEWASVRLACAAPLWRAKLIVARVDPRAVRLSLEMDLSRDGFRPGWSLARAPSDAILAVNAGQFATAMPWGWVVMDGRQHLRPGSGPLASAVAIESSGRVRWSHGDSLLDPTGIVAGFQSFPTLLAGDGVVPAALRRSGSGVNLRHRDTRLAVGQTRDGWLLIALTRFDAVNGLVGGFPIGPTTPEMAAIMGALGASDAVMLDGGISAQLLLRDPARRPPLEWKGMRRVPLALVGRPRERSAAGLRRAP